MFLSRRVRSLAADASCDSTVGRPLLPRQPGSTTSSTQDNGDSRYSYFRPESAAVREVAEERADRIPKSMVITQVAAPPNVPPASLA